MADEVKQESGVSLNARVKKNDHWQHVPIDELTAEELRAVLTQVPDAQRVVLAEASSGVPVQRSK